MTTGRKYPRSQASIVEVPQKSIESNSEFSTISHPIENYSGKVYASHRMGFSPQNIGGSGISGRYGFTHQDYEAWRPNEASSFRNVKDMILYSDMCYAKHGLIRNVMDLMGDFASQGIRLVHPNKRIEKFFQHWFDKVEGKERSERFLNNLYKLGNVVIRIQTAKINKSIQERLYKTSAEAEFIPQISRVAKNEIPWKYNFLHPATVIVIGGPLASFSGDKKYAIQLPSNLRNIIKSPKNSVEKTLVSQLPLEIRQAADTFQPILLPSEKTRVFHYKKDDWQEWASPIISSIALEISLYEKLKLADRSALDGAISNIRIFKLGNLEYKIAPSAEAAAMLANILESNTEAGTLDLIWGPDIEMVESKTNVHEFLGEEKYKPTLTAIYAGLGIPPTLTGTFGAAGTTNNFVSLKTLIQRLEYGRDMLVQFWNEQVRIVQEAMGFRFPAMVEFDLMNLGDEIAEKRLLIDMVDRNLMSDELIQRYMGGDPDMETVRIKRQQREIENGVRTPKAGPYHDAQVEDGLKKVALQSGVVTPSEVGLELESKKRGEKSAMDFKAEQIAMKPAPTGLTKKGTPGQGRPKNSKDKVKRKPKRFTPKTRATIEVWAANTLSIIDEIINPMMLSQYNKKNMRALSSVEFDNLENTKFGVLFNIEPLSKVDETIVVNAVSKPFSNMALSRYISATKDISQHLKHKLSIQERRQLQVNIYTSLKEFSNGESGY